jgi:hypothetical protein
MPARALDTLPLGELRVAREAVARGARKARENRSRVRARLEEGTA